MEDSKKLWQRFEKSGKLADYLEYCRKRRSEQKAEAWEDKDDQSSL